MREKQKSCRVGFQASARRNGGSEFFSQIYFYRACLQIFLLARVMSLKIVSQQQSVI